jgi:hypothetical protein
MVRNAPPKIVSNKSVAVNKNCRIESKCVPFRSQRLWPSVGCSGAGHWPNSCKPVASKVPPRDDVCPAPWYHYHTFDKRCGNQCRSLIFVQKCVWGRTEFRQITQRSHHCGASFRKPTALLMALDAFYSLARGPGVYDRTRSDRRRRQVLDLFLVVGRPILACSSSVWSAKEVQ